MAFATDITSSDVFEAEVLSTPGILQGALCDSFVCLCTPTVHPYLIPTLLPLHAVGRMSRLRSRGVPCRLGRALQGGGKLTQGVVLHLQ